MSISKKDFIIEIKSLVSFWKLSINSEEDKLDGLAFSILSRFDELSLEDLNELDNLHEIYYKE